MSENTPHENPEGEPIVPSLRAQERSEVERRAALRVLVVHEAVRKEGEDELRRPPSALAWSGLSAGLSMGFSLVAQGILMAALPDAPWRPLITRFGYALGFLIVVIGRQQLFTENTVRVVIPLLARRNRATLLAVLRLWGIVLLANLLGAFIFAWSVYNPMVFAEPVRHSFLAIGREVIGSGHFLPVLLKAIYAGWLIALMVWLLPAAEHSRVAIVIIITYIVGLGGFDHIIAGSAEVSYLVVAGIISWGTFLMGFMIPTLLGNIIGGVILVALLNHAQTVAGNHAEA